MPSRPRTHEDIHIYLSQQFSSTPGERNPQHKHPLRHTPHVFSRLPRTVRQPYSLSQARRKTKGTVNVGKRSQRNSESTPCSSNTQMRMFGIMMPTHLIDHDWNGVNHNGCKTKWSRATSKIKICLEVIHEQVSRLSVANPKLTHV